MSQEAPGRLEAVRRFVNSVDLENDTDELSSPEALATWLDRHELGPVGAAGAADLDRAIELREALRGLLLGRRGAAPAIDAAARRARLEVRFDADGTASLLPAADGVDAALGRVIAIVAEAQADGSWTRMKACPWDTCGWAFYDHSKNRSGVWCDMAVCGNRAKARAYRQRQARAV